MCISVAARGFVLFCSTCVGELICLGALFVYFFFSFWKQKLFLFKDCSLVGLYVLYLYLCVVEPYAVLLTNLVVSSFWGFSLSLSLFQNMVVSLVVGLQLYCFYTCIFT